MHGARESWLPVRAALQPDGLYLALRGIPRAELRDPFMQETVQRVAAPESIVRIGRGDVGKSPGGAEPAGLVFHVARCGSTVVSQLLRELDAAVYAEPLPVNELLLPPQAWPREELVAALRSLGAAFAGHAGGRYLLKLSSWNTLFCDLLAEAFPRTPWVLSIRDPVEVAVSLLAQPPGWLRESEEPARRVYRVVQPEGAPRSAEERVARVYGAFCEAAARLDRARGRLIQYESLPASVWEVVAPHFSLTAGATERQRMAEAARSYSKSPLGKATAYADDSARKRAGASAVLLAAIDEFARPALSRLMSRHAPMAAAQS
jgi:hypothetical protein